MERFETVGRALDEAARHLRRQVNDETAPLAVVAPMHLNNAFARRAIAETGPQIRLYYYTPESLVRELAARALATLGLQPESPARRVALVADAVDEAAAAGELKRFAETLVVPGWKRVLSSTLERLEAAGLSDDDLRAPDAADWIQDRLRILRTLLKRVSARRQTLSVAGPLQIRDAALAGLADPATPCNELRGVVVFGDRDLSMTTFEPLRQWLGEREFVRVAVDPIDNVQFAEAPSMRTAGKPTATFHVSAPGDLGCLQRELWAAPSRGEMDGIEFVRTPDEVRENEEAVRFVQREIAAGVPLDRIAIVLPDDAHREALSTALERAGIPTTSFVTPNLSQRAAGKFLVLALEMAAGRQGVDTWYDLLRQRRLRLKAGMAELPAGRGRWRRLLATCGAYSGAENIRRALERLAEEADDPIDEAGARSLANTIGVVDAAIGDLLKFSTMAGFAHNCRTFAEAWWRHSGDRAHLFDVLRQLESAGREIDVDLDSATAQLQQALENTPVREGYLSDASVRVLPPMAAVGCDFDVVCVLGLVQGRLPRRRRPEPILADEVLEALEARHLGIYLRRDPGLVEKRRFAAAVSAARRKLWLSSPAFEGLAERPRVPSNFALDALATQIGRRSSYRDLETMRSTSGSLAHPYPEDPDDAIGARDYLVSGLAAGEVSLAAQLTSHAFARNLLRLHLSLGADAPIPDVTRTNPASAPLPALDGEPLPTWHLSALLHDPGAYFMQRVLGAYRARRLRGVFSPLASWWINTQLAHALEEAADSGGEFIEALQRSWETIANEALDLNDAASSVAEVVLELGRRQSVRLAVQAGEDFGQPVVIGDATVLDTSLPWAVEPATIRANGSELVNLLSELRWEDRDELMLQIAAASRYGYELRGAVSIEATGKSTTSDRAKYFDDTFVRLSRVTRLVAAGCWPWGASLGPWTLSDDRAHKLSAEILEELEGGL